MRMPFEQLMEQIDALSDEDAALPMGALAARWDVPVLRVADAIDAVRVLHGEHTYIEVQPEPEPPCRAFRWIGQPFSSCDRCSKPAWEHDGEEQPREGAGLFDPDPFEFRPWKPGEAEAIKRKWSRLLPPVAARLDQMITLVAEPADLPVPPVQAPLPGRRGGRGRVRDDPFSTRILEYSRTRRRQHRNR